MCFHIYHNDIWDWNVRNRDPLETGMHKALNVPWQSKKKKRKKILIINQQIEQIIFILSKFENYGTSLHYQQLG